MSAHRLLLGFTLSLLICPWANPAPAEEIIEAWRSPIGPARSVAVDASDGSCWAGVGASVVQLAEDGSLLSQTDGFRTPECVSANSSDGSCWVADTGDNEVVHLAADGTELWRGSGFRKPRSISVNPTDGSCWVADSGNGQVVHLAADGTELWRGSGFKGPWSVSVNLVDGSCWVADRGGQWVSGRGEVVHLAEDGTELWRGEEPGYPVALSVNPTDGSCWVAHRAYWDSDSAAHVVPAIVHLAEDGADLLRREGFERPESLSTNPADGSCWVADSGQGALVHLEEDGTEISWEEGLGRPVSLSVNPDDGSCWVVDYQTGHVVHLTKDGSELWRASNLRLPISVSANPKDGSCWVVDLNDVSFTQNNYQNSVVLHLSADGTVLWRSEAFDTAGSVSTSPDDGSCWVALRGHWESGHRVGSAVVHLAQDGGELWRGEQFDEPWSVSVNPTDGSCWVADLRGDAVVHVAADGTELWRGGGFERPVWVSVNSADGSCWVAFGAGDYPLGIQVAHLAEDGTELWRGAHLSGPVAADPTDGSCWAVSLSGYLIRLSGGGVTLARASLGRFDGLPLLAVNPTDGSCWVAAARGTHVVHLSRDGTALSRSENFLNPRSVSVDPSDGSCWVADTGRGQVVRLRPLRPGDVTPDQGRGSGTSETPLPAAEAYGSSDAQPDGGLVGTRGDATAAEPATAPGPAATAQQSNSQHYRIAFAGDATGDSHGIYTMDGDGSGLTLVKEDVAPDAGPLWSSDGRKIAFSSRGHIFSMDADGSGLKNLTKDTLHGEDPTCRPDSRRRDTSYHEDPSWSPDSRRIAYASQRGNGHDIFVMDADGSGKTRLTQCRADERFPSWSPDGRTIAFLSNRGGEWGIHVTNADGTCKPRRLTDRSGLPRWSPDGSSIAFVSGRDGNAEIYIMNPDGSGKRNLTNHPLDDREFSWSPDGRKIVFERHGVRDSPADRYDICVMNADGTEQKNLSNELQDDRSPSWSPDGRMIAFIRSGDRGDQVYTIDADGIGVQRLTAFLGCVHPPSWCPVPVEESSLPDQALLTPDIDGSSSGQGSAGTAGDAAVIEPDTPEPAEAGHLAAETGRTVTVTDWRSSVCYDALWHIWGHERIEAYPEATTVGDSRRTRREPGLGGLSRPPGRVHPRRGARRAR